MKKEWLYIGFTAILVSSILLIITVAAAPSCTCGSTACGQAKCIGQNQFQCQDGQWLLAQQNAPACGYVPPTPPETKLLTLWEAKGPELLTSPGPIKIVARNVGGKTVTLTGGEVSGTIAWHMTDTADGSWSTGSSSAFGFIRIYTTVDPITYESIPLPITGPITKNNVRSIELWALALTPYPADAVGDRSTYANWYLFAEVSWIEY